MTFISAERLVFLDESFCNTSMAREYGWAPIGKRAVGTRPGKSWKTLTLIGAIRLGCNPKLMTYPGPVDRRIFLRFVRRRLAPWLKPGDVVLMDNLGAHKGDLVREAIEAVGAHLVFLPTYSPDMNPIELCWSDIKRRLRKIAPRIMSDLKAAARRVTATTPLHKIAGWFRHCLAFAQVN